MAPFAAATAAPLVVAMATAITSNEGQHVVPHVLRESKGTKPYTVHNAPDGKIIFNGKPEDWVKMRDAMVDVIQSGTGRGIKSGLQYSIAGKTGTAQITNNEPNHALFVSFAPYENPEISITVVIPNGFSSSNAAELASKVYQYYYDKSSRKKLMDGKVSSPAMGGTRQTD